MRRIRWIVLALAACSDGKRAPDGDDTIPTTPNGDDGTDILDTGDTDDGTEWTGPADVRLDGGASLAVDPESTDVHLCVDGDHVVVAWVDERSGLPAVYVNHSLDGGATWLTDPVDVSRSPSIADAPALACGGGNAWLAWEDARDSKFEDGDVYLATSHDGGATWGEPVPLGVEPLGLYSGKSIAIAVDGSNVLAAWASNPDGAYDIYARVSHDAGDSFGPPLRLDTDDEGAAYSTSPEVAIQGSLAYVAWEDRRSGTVDVYLARSTDGGDSFEAEERLDAGKGNSYSPRLAAHDHDLMAVWHDSANGDRYDVYAAWSDEAATEWAELLLLDPTEPGAMDDASPSVAMVDGMAHVAWYTEQEGGYHIAYAGFAGGVPVAAQPATIDGAPGEAWARRPLVAAGADGVVVAWEDERDAATDGPNDLYYAWSSDNGGTWATDLRLRSAPTASSTATDLQLELASGRVLAAWSDDREGTADVYFIGLSLGEAAPYPGVP